MDYIDYTNKASPDHFYFKAKQDFIKLLVSKFKKKHALRILNVGVGSGEELDFLSDFGEVYVVDINKDVLNLIQNHAAKKIVQDICKNDFPDNFFDLVLCFDTFEHIENDALAICQIYRILKAGGRVIFTVPAFQIIYSRHDRALGHFRRYSPSSIRKKLKDFECIKLGWWSFLLFFPVCIKRIIFDKIYPCAESKAKPDSSLRLHPIINGLFYGLLNVENIAIRHNVALPLGVSMYGIYQKAG